MSGGPVDIPRRTIIPRPGVSCSMVITYEPVDPSAMPVGRAEEMRIANIQSAINERFAEPREMGTAEITFRSDVDIRDVFVIVRTTTTFIGPETIEEMGDIVEREVGAPMELFQISADIRRKTMETDFL